MLTNGSFTLYHLREDGGYDRAFIPECFWMDARGSSATTGAMAASRAITIYLSEKVIPAEIASRDIVVYGNCAFTFTNDTPETISQSLRELVETYEVATITEIEDKRYGSALRHIKVTAK